MKKVVSLIQSSFVPNRQSRDNIIITQEVIHSMKMKNGEKGWMDIKVDLEKVNDRLSWDFIIHTLKEVGLPSNYADVFHCVSSSSIKMLWNGEALEEFYPTRGIRQGDPLSSYLFVLCMER